MWAHALVSVSRQDSSSANSPFSHTLQKFGSALLGPACPMPSRGSGGVPLPEISLSLSGFAQDVCLPQLREGGCTG